MNCESSKIGNTGRQLLISTGDLHFVLQHTANILQHLGLNHPHSCSEYPVFDERNYVALLFTCINYPVSNPTNSAAKITLHCVL